MKDFEQAVADELRKAQQKPEELTSLNLDSKCKAEQIKGLDAFTNLRTLSLCSLGLKTLEGFPPLPKLTTLTLSDNRLTGGLSHLVDAGLTSLRKLDLANNRIKDLKELEPLKQLGLDSLDLLDCPVTRAADFDQKLFAMLDELKYLNGYDKAGVERDGDDDEEDFDEDDGGEEEFDEGAGGDAGEEEYEDEEGGEFDEGQEPIGEDEEGDYEDEGEDDEDEDAPPSGGVKRKRGDDDNAGPDDDDEDEEDDEAE